MTDNTLRIALHYIHQELMTNINSLPTYSKDSEWQDKVIECRRRLYVTCDNLKNLIHDLGEATSDPS